MAEEKRTTTRRLNMLKRQVFGIHAQLNHINNELMRLGENREGWMINSDTSRMENLRAEMLSRIQYVANLHQINGDYTQRLSWEQTRQGKAWLNKQAALQPLIDKIDAAFSAPGLPSKDSPEYRRMIELSLSERKGLDSGSES